MKKLFTLSLMMLLGLGAFAQSIPVTFESDITVGSNWKGDSGIGEVSVVADPEDGGTHGQVGKIVEDAGGLAWQNAQLLMTTNYFDLSGSNKTISFDYYSTVASGGLLKIEQPLGTGAATLEVAFSTSGNGWETINVDFSSVGAADQYKLLVFFPGIGNGNGVTNEITYVDNISGVVGAAIVSEPLPTVSAPVPTHAEADVISIYSDSYTNVSVDTYKTDWSACGAVSDVEIDGNFFKSYADLNYAGINHEAAKSINATGMTHIHVDVWTAGATTFKVKLVDFGAGGIWGGGDDTEHEVVVTPITLEEWNSIDIPLSEFTGLASMANLSQTIISADPIKTVNIDNLYFYNDNTTSVSHMDEKALKLYPNPASDILQIEGVEKGEFVEVYNLTGKLVKKMQAQGSAVSVADLKQGVYFVKVNGTTSKIVKK